MKRLMNFLQGMVTLTLVGPFPERLINLCAQEGIEFWAMEWLDEHTVRMTTRRRTLKRLEGLAQRAACEITGRSSRGLPDFLGRFRTRYAFLAGLAFALCAVSVLSRFVLTIQVTGNQTVPTAVILSQLRQLGVRPGVYGPSLDRKQLAQEALLALDDLSWMAINLHGTRLEVIVREEVKRPERLDEKAFCDIVAEADGIVTRIEPELGDPLVKVGDTVLAGETLISGTVTLEPPIYSDLPARSYQTHARGRIWARTWRTLSSSIPLETTVKDYSGEEKNSWSLNFSGQRIEILGSTSISWPTYDKITTVYQASLPGGESFPLSLTRETCRAYEPRVVEVNQDAAQSLVEERLLERLRQLVGGDGQISDTQFTAQVKDGMLAVTLNAECIEEIGRERPGAQPIQSGTEESAP